ncbi:ImmA/IrrE family metallo-endopeptidase [Paenibacillus sp. HW567]|uniref:ImmA/IrrE family metallo-endopeptidase n=1 Tax=Paenibacillus sp. HW567 TaxID=1034769 RepID=UPI00036C6666|nr:ImmA/IrrE family metallo-endopeptidase [Paenibacillus sp. HW567]
MPELTSEHLPVLLKQNKEVYYEVDHYIKTYLKNEHPSGWTIVDGAMRWIEENHHFIQAPIKDDSLGGFILFKSPKVICYLNSWQPRIYQNFILLHELFHTLSRTKHVNDELHLVESDLDRDLDERKADYFASLLLLDAAEVVTFYQNLGEDDLLDKIILTMFRFSAPYKAVLIRLFELELINGEELKNRFDVKYNLEAEFTRLGKDPSPVQRSLIINFQDVVKVMESGKGRLPDVANDNNWSTLKNVMQYFEARRRTQ